MLRPYKKFRHFINCLAIYFSMAKQLAEEKQRRKRIKARGHLPLTSRPTYLAQPSQKPAQPTRGRVVFHPRPGRQLVGVASMPATAPPPGCFPGHLALPVDAWKAPLPFFPPGAIPLSLSRELHAPPQP